MFETAEKLVVYKVLLQTDQPDEIGLISRLERDFEISGSDVVISSKRIKIELLKDQINKLRQKDSSIGELTEQQEHEIWTLWGEISKLEFEIDEVRSSNLTEEYQEFCGCISSMLHENSTVRTSGILPNGTFTVGTYGGKFDRALKIELSPVGSSIELSQKDLVNLLSIITKAQFELIDNNPQ